MQMSDEFEIFLVALPGLEPMLCDEVRALGFAGVRIVPGGVALRGGWPEVWRANLWLRGATRVLVRIGEFRAFHLAQLDKRARKFPWGDFLRADVPVRVEASSTRSKIYHAGAAAQRVARAISEELGAPIVETAEAVAEEGAVRVMLRIDDNLCTLSLDSSGAGLHKRGHKLAMGKAPLRESMAALFLRQCGYTGAETVVDPMCGSGTFVIEAAEIAAGLAPGRTRGFAFERFAGFDAQGWAAMRAGGAVARDPGLLFHGSDRDAGAVRMAGENAERAGVAAWCEFSQMPFSDMTPPEGPPGLVMVNPPYGGRIGNKKLLYGLYGALGGVLKERFSGWRVGLVTSEPGLAKACGLPFAPPGAPVAHGGLKVKLYRCQVA
ncbi:THUMP domain-containing class I SAM-dependent RNA methyltransferase [Antarcticimicrobium luteum]|uniref:Class I SAM-dependent RNA methyltransferase n=1 Tax=Antarcticimicrobium luteum TaxID=2547397 RepID=A0A4R5VFN8_9RHOB|nr:class I SAM-dependent RNA methyltransferase [Antarcticimicrobium luteum]TDK51256.1 class I SAM-dependent RNA methyltransferase [Antarcticimicrobium luteum]